jgi:broad specificity phosphatase PhoE
MGTLFLVRHGQASFLADDYDQLSPLGARQCERLGRYFASRGLGFEAVYTGTLRRHAQSLAAIAQALAALSVRQMLPALDEYDAHALVAAAGVPVDRLPSRDTDEGRRQHFRLLRGGLSEWMAGRLQPPSMPSWADFSAGVAAVLERIRREHAGHVLIVSSGGPIATAVGQVLATPPQSVIELNMRMRNSALSEFSFTSKRHALVVFNALPHLEGVDPADWVTHS